MWNQDYTPNEIRNLSGFFRQVGDHCRGLAPDKGRRVAVSPFFNPWIKPGEEGEGFLAPAPFALKYGQFLDGARVDLVTLQDSVGAKGLKVGDFQARVVPYIQAFSDLCRMKKVDYWGNVESFEIVPDQPDKYRYWPTDIVRFQEQIRVTAPFVRGQLITFDFFHYMNPYSYLHEGQEGGMHVKRESDLYDAYKKTFVP